MKGGIRYTILNSEHIFLENSISSANFSSHCMTSLVDDTIGDLHMIYPKPSIICGIYGRGMAWDFFNSV